MSNSLQAVLDKAKDKTEKPPVIAKTKPVAKSKAGSRQTPKPGRSNTVLIGGHFAPAVLKQLRILAAEEGTTNQALLEQALDLLFVKKGKGHIADL